HMSILPWVITYNGMGRDEILDLAASFLMGDPPRAFGSAIKELELYVNVKTRTTVSRAPVGKQRRNYVRGLGSLPIAQFLRRYSKLNITYLTRLAFEQYSVQIYGTNKYEKERRIVQSALSFRAACEEMAENLRLIQTKLTKSDDFKWDAFSKH